MLYKISRLFNDFDMNGGWGRFGRSNTDKEFIKLVPQVLVALIGAIRLAMQGFIFYLHWKLPILTPFYITNAFVMTPR